MGQPNQLSQPPEEPPVLPNRVDMTEKILSDWRRFYENVFEEMSNKTQAVGPEGRARLSQAAAGAATELLILRYKYA
jgi:hypothetical protein